MTRWVTQWRVLAKRQKQATQQVLQAPKDLTLKQIQFKQRVEAHMELIRVRAMQQITKAPLEALKMVLFDEFMEPDHESLAKLRLQKQRDLQQCIHETLGNGPSGQRSLTNVDMGDFGDLESELWLVDQMGPQGMRTGGDNARLLAQLDSRERARHNLVSFAPNQQRLKETQFLAGIKTRDQMLEVLSRNFNDAPMKALSTGHLHNRTHFVDSWCKFCTEVLHICWVRWTCLLEMNQRMIRKEENYLLAFLTYGRIRYKTFNQVEQSISHVRRWHEDHMNISFPAYPRLQSRLRLGRHEDKRKRKCGLIRKRRGNIKNEHLIPVCVFLHAIIADETASMSLRLVAASMLCIMTAAFQLLFRIGELARGADFDPNIHWCRTWLAPLLTLQDGGDACIPQTQRKIITELYNHGIHADRNGFKQPGKFRKRIQGQSQTSTQLLRYFTSRLRQFTATPRRVRY